jgi:UDP-N-acetylglucosamine 2-epimerase (non-hydrolysing)
VNRHNPERPVLVVAGARPNFMKVVPILRELDRRGIPRLFVHTGQHYDVQMSEALLKDLAAPEPDIVLEVGSASHAVQTARVMERFEPVLLAHRPAWVVVVGDVNSTLACALVAAKLRRDIGCRIAHVEAGLRSNDWAMPEEVNRVLTDRLSDLLLKPSEDADEHILREGLTDIRAEFVGNVMIDSMLAVLPKARELGLAKKLGVTPGEYVVATLHRPSNVDDPQRFSVLIEALARIAKDRHVVFPMHPRTKAQRATMDDLLGTLIVTEPFGYTEMVAMLDGAAAALTDSGGVQQETTVLGVPCVTVREQTEWPYTVTHGTNRLATWPLTVTGIVQDVERATSRGRLPLGSAAPPGWDGHAAARIVSALVDK